MNNTVSNKNNRSLLIVFTSILVWMGITFSYSRLLSPMFAKNLNENLRVILGSIIVPYGIALPISFQILKTVKPIEKKKGDKLKIGCAIKMLIVQSGLGILSMFILNLIFINSGLLEIDGNINSEKITMLSIFILLIFNPVVEELFFRKLILDRLIVYGNLKAIIISAIIFALPHISSQGIPTAVMTFVVGIVWAYARIKTQTLWIPILLHAFSNLWGSILPSLLTQTELGLKVYMAIWVVIVPIMAIIILVRDRKKVISSLK